MAGDFTSAWDSVEKSEGAVGGRDGEGDDDVVEAVGGVGEAGVGIENDVGGAGGSLKIGWAHGNLLDGLEGSRLCVPAEDDYGGGHLGDAVSDAAVGVELEGSWTGAGSGVPGGGFAWAELSGARIEAIDVDAIEAEIVDEQEAVVGGDGDAVGVRGFLTGWVGAAAGVLEERDGGAEVPVERDGE